MLRDCVEDLAERLGGRAGCFTLSRTDPGFDLGVVVGRILGVGRG